MAKYKAYIFDFDLTLADSSKGIIECFGEVLKRFGYAVPEDKVIFNTIGMTFKDTFDILTGVKDNPKCEEMRRTSVEVSNRVMSKNTFFYDNVIAVLQSLKNAGVKVGIVSSKMRFRIAETFEMQAHCHPYDLIVGFEDVKDPKPAPEGINFAVEKFNLDKSEVLYIGDSFIDAETALNAGVDFAGVTTGPTDRQTLEKYPNVYIGENILDVFLNI